MKRNVWIKRPHRRSHSPVSFYPWCNASEIAVFHRHLASGYAEIADSRQGIGSRRQLFFGRGILHSIHGHFRIDELVGSRVGNRFAGRYHKVRFHCLIRVPEMTRAYPGRDRTEIIAKACRFAHHPTISRAISRRLFAACPSGFSNVRVRHPCSDGQNRPHFRGVETAPASPKPPPSPIPIRARFNPYRQPGSAPDIQ
jgi:hypothetical protein